MEKAAAGRRNRMSVQIRRMQLNKHRNYDTKEYHKSGAYFRYKALFLRLFMVGEQDKCPYQNASIFTAEFRGSSKAPVK